MRIVVLCLHGPKSVLAVPTAVSRLPADPCPRFLSTSRVDQVNTLAVYF